MQPQDYIFLNVYLFILREGERAGKGQKEVERESQAASVLSAQSLMQGLNLQTMRSRPELKPRIGR